MEENQPQVESRKINPLVFVAIALLIVLGGIAFLNANNQNKKTQATETTPVQQQSQTSDGTTAPQTTKSEEPTTGSATNGPDTNGVEIVSVEAGSFYYKPNEIRVKKGQTVKIVMTSKDMMHDFTIDELNVNMPVIQAGKTGEVEFTPEKAGTYEFYCSVGQHRQNGQVGTLIVE